MASPSFKKKVRVSTDGTVWSDLPATTASLNLAGDLLDDTDLATNSGYRSRTYGLRDWNVPVTCNWVPGDPALQIVRDAWTNSTAIFIQYLPDGAVANGLEGPCVVENYNLSGDVGALETVEFTLQADGAIGPAS